MGKKACSDSKAIKKKSKGTSIQFYCKKCGEEAAKEKWVCKPQKIA